MRDMEKPLLAVDFSDLCESRVRHTLQIAARMGTDVILYHLASYGQALTSDGAFYNETNLPGVGLKSPEQFLAERKDAVEQALKCHLAHDVTRVHVHVDLDTRLPDKILEKADGESVRAIVMPLPCPDGDPVLERTATEVKRRATVPVVSFPVAPLAPTKPASEYALL